MTSPHDDSLRILAPLTGTVLRDYRRTPLPAAIRRFIAAAERSALQTALVEIVARLHAMGGPEDDRPA